MFGGLLFLLCGGDISVLERGWGIGGKDGPDDYDICLLLLLLDRVGKDGGGDGGWHCGLRC